MADIAIISVPDIHGSDGWKEIVKNKADTYVFLGDYVDHWTRSNVEILHNLKEIIDFKSNNMDKVKLLTGNHDFQYMFGNLYTQDFTCSGFRPEAYWDLYNIFQTYDTYFDVAWESDNYLFTHAGVINGWWKLREKAIKAIYHKYHGAEEGVKISEYLNFLRLVKEREYLWDVGRPRGGMRGDYGSPIWADQQESRFGALPGYHHVVGHTPVPDVKTYTINKETTITYCDCMDKTSNYYFIGTKQ